MQEEIKTALNVLIGLPLCSAGRAADLEWFHFGRLRTITQRGKTKEVGDYALHVQCAWRIASTEQVIVGSRDLYELPEHAQADSDDFNWDVHMGNRRDLQMAQFLDNSAFSPLVVRAIEVGLAGNVRVFFTDTCALEIFPYDSLTDDYSEHWRFFRPGDNSSHFVFTGVGIEE